MNLPGEWVMGEDFVIIDEGRAKVKIPNPLKYLRPDRVFEPAWAPVFYNPAQVLNRDISVMVLKTLLRTRSFEKPVRVADPFSGTGVRTVRYGVEVPEVDEIYANDIDPNAFKLTLENIRMNGLEGRARAMKGDANAILYLLRSLGISFVLVDVDPYGSPAPYVDAGIWSTRSEGVLAITATDVAPLSGAKHVAGSRRYDARILPSDVGADVGLRVLLAFVARRAAVRDRAALPLFSLHSGHYYRVFVKVLRGASKAAEVLSANVGYLLMCERCGFREFVPEPAEGECVYCGGRLKALGPLWRGGLVDVQFLNELRRGLNEFSYLQTVDRLSNLLEVIGGELTHLPMYNLVALARLYKVNTPPVQRVIDCLTGGGFNASRTHLSPQCIRTDAPHDMLVECLRGS
ncbi:MAG: tRNA (guanine(10)-N(2))-dimethyltransferase [Zestosphaera sp.]